MDLNCAIINRNLWKIGKLKSIECAYGTAERSSHNRLTASAQDVISTGKHIRRLLSSARAAKGNENNPEFPVEKQSAGKIISGGLLSEKRLVKFVDWKITIKWWKYVQPKQNNVLQGNQEVFKIKEIENQVNSLIEIYNEFKSY